MEEIKQITCDKCGKMYYDDNNFCPYCGAKTKFFKGETDQQNYNNQSNSSQTKISDDMIILIVLLIVFWPAALIYYLVKMRK